jgi:hypothetical protein
MWSGDLSLLAGLLGVADFEAKGWRVAAHCDGVQWNEFVLRADRSFGNRLLRKKVTLIEYAHAEIWV